MYVLTGGLVVVHVYPLQLELVVPMVDAGGVDAVLVGDYLPELLNTHQVQRKSNKRSSD